MRALPSRPSRLLTAAAIAATSLALVPAPPTQAAGSPDIDLTKDMPARALAGDPQIPVTLTATNSTATNGYNLSLKDVLPPGVSLVAGDPAPTTVLNDSPAANYTTLLWENLADLPTGSAYSVSYTFTHDATYDVGDTITNDASAYVNSNPRFIPKFDPTGVPSDYTGNDADSKTTQLVPFLLEKIEPNDEAELLRGLHDHQTPYTLEISNNFRADSTNLKIDDWVPAGMEYLICGTDDYSAGEEYAGSELINAPGNAPPLANPCIRPTTVDTVTLDPDGAGPLPSALYTHVLWDVAELGLTLTPGEVWRMDYVPAIPLNANAAFGAPPAPATLQQAANIDNNTGPSTQETLSELSLQNYALLTGEYTGDGQQYTDDAYEQVSAEDVSIHKSVDNPTIGQGNIDTWTLLIESSEYVSTASGIVVTDTVPDGLCPLGPGTVEGTAECDFGGEPGPSHPYALATRTPTAPGRCAGTSTSPAVSAPWGAARAARSPSRPRCASTTRRTAPTRHPWSPKTSGPTGSTWRRRQTAGQSGTSHLQARRPRPFRSSRRSPTSHSSPVRARLRAATAPASFGILPWAATTDREIAPAGGSP